MPFIIEISAPKHRFLTSSLESLVVSADKFGVPEISAHQESASFLFKITKLPDSNFELLKNDGSNLIFNYYATLKVEDYSFKIFYISRQAEVLSKINNPQLLGRSYSYRLECPVLCINVGLFKDTRLSVGSSEFDSMTIVDQDLKPRHFEIQLKDAMQTSDIYGSIGQIQNKTFINEQMIFKAANLEFILSKIDAVLQSELKTS